MRILKVANTCQFLQLLFQLLIWFYTYVRKYVLGHNMHYISCCEMTHCFKAIVLMSQEPE